MHDKLIKCISNQRFLRTPLFDMMKSFSDLIRQRNFVGHRDKFIFVGHKDIFVGNKDILGSGRRRRRRRRKIYSCVRPREAKLITWSKISRNK